MPLVYLSPESLVKDGLSRVETEWPSMVLEVSWMGGYSWFCGHLLGSHWSSWCDSNFIEMKILK